MKKHHELLEIRRRVDRGEYEKITTAQLRTLRLALMKEIGDICEAMRAFDPLVILGQGDSARSIMPDDLR